jgi:hypothetical protein
MACLDTICTIIAAVSVLSLILGFVFLYLKRSPEPIFLAGLSGCFAVMVLYRAVHFFW